MGPVVVAVDVAGDRLAGLVEGLELLAPDQAFLKLREPRLRIFERGGDGQSSSPALDLGAVDALLKRTEADARPVVNKAGAQLGQRHEIVVKLDQQPGVRDGGLTKCKVRVRRGHQSHCGLRSADRQGGVRTSAHPSPSSTRGRRIRVVYFGRPPGVSAVTDLHAEHATMQALQALLRPRVPHPNCHGKEGVAGSSPAEGFILALQRGLRRSGYSR